MLTPSITNPTTQFYALGNTPATNLAKCLPSGVDAIILLLGCGDARNILFTTYCERGLPSRKLDFVCCDIVEDIHARNIVLFTFLLDGVSGRSLDALWDIYYHLYLDDEAMTLFHSQLKKLRSLSETLDEWRAGPYGPFLRFCDPATFDDFRRILAKYDDAVKSQESPSYKISFHSSISSSKELMRSRFGSGAAAASAARSAAPLGLKSLGDVKGAFRHYWENGTSGPKRPDEKTPNPMFAVSVSDNTLLHYGTDPVQGFHLATGFADLAEASPLRPNKKESELFKAVGAAKTQFREWARAFQAIKERMVIRVVTSDALVLCHTLQHRLSSGHTRRSAHWFRRQLEMQKLELDALDYGQRENEVQEAKGLTVPLKFDVIDTSNLGDHIGTLNLLVAAAPILTNTPFSTVQTELLIRREASEKETFDKLLCGHGPTMAALLGLTPAEYYTNATTVSSVDELLLSVGAGTSGDDLAGQQLRSQISWKLSHHFTGRSRFQTALNIDAQDLAKILFTAYHNMFEFESISSFMDSGKLSMDKIRNSTYPFFHRGSLVALMRYVEHRVKTDWTRTCQTLIDTIYQDRKLVIGTNYVQDLALHMHMWGVHSESWIKHDIERNSRSTGGISSWKHIPEIVAVTLIVPRAKFGRLFSPGVDKRAAPILQISMRSSQGAAKQWHNFFSDVHLVFGDATPRGHRDSHDLVLKIDEDPDGWAGRSPLLVCFYAPSCALQVEPRTALIGLSLQQTIQNMSVYSNVIGPELSVYETTLGDESRVFFTKFLPGQDAYPTVSPPLTHHAGRGQKKKELEKASLTANIDQGTGKIISMTGHTDIQSPQGKKLLEDKVPIELRQSSPFVIDAIFGDGILVYPIQFAVAVVKDGSRMRIARKSSYVDVIAPLADPITTNGLADLIFPSTLDLYNKSTTLSIPHVNPDGLPILELADKKALSWLTTLTSFMFSPREKLLRGEAQKSSTGISSNPRLNYKESLFTIFMLSSGLQGGQTGLFGITHPKRGGIHMLIFVSSLRLDGSNGSVVADAAVLPFTLEIIQEDRELHAFLAMCGELGMCTLSVDDEELILWKRVLPALVERCRSWSHGADCEYKQEGASVPLSIEPAKQGLCSCGRGKLPIDFIALPDWESAAKYSTRIAISPTYAVPFVEDVLDTTLLKQAKSMAVDQKKGGDSTSGSGSGEQLPAMLESLQIETCRCCGAREANKGGPLKKCSRCQEVKYCSAECQKKDWKKHRMECGEKDA